MNMQEIESVVQQYVELRRETNELLKIKEQKLRQIYKEIELFLKQFYELNKKYDLKLNQLTFNLYSKLENGAYSSYHILKNIEFGSRFYIGIDETPFLKLFDLYKSRIDLIDLEYSKEKFKQDFINKINEMKGKLV